MASISTAILILLLASSLSVCSRNAESSLAQAGTVKGMVNTPTEDSSVQLKYAYARKIRVLGEQAYSLLLTEQPLPEDVLKRGDDFRYAELYITRIHFLIDEKGRIREVSLAVLPKPGVNYRDTKSYSESQAKSVSIRADRIEGELSEEGVLGIKDKINWNFKVSFETSILKQ